MKKMSYKATLAVNINITVFCDVTPYNAVCRYKPLLPAFSGHKIEQIPHTYQTTHTVFHVTVILKRNVLESKCDFLEKCAIKL
jgi:hypothetical protein